ncbi:MULTISPECIES: pseudaminic acid synthase [unclassified Butyrivibrio]|uniref:pseudaminic acid synthase n=1 Tax=unclassified Butyrivibrio TaxID=2639466 RepID=UPI000408FAD8|nr:MULTISPECIES: pseudaminic acid synthase [unclassified Butyrivibrio]
MRLQECLDNHRAYMIAEMSANHGGSLENALAIVEAAAKAGADCLKTQTYTADTITIDCDAEAFKIHGGLWDGYNLHDLYKEAYTPWEWMEPIKKKCEELGIDFLSTPFDKTSVDYLENIGEEFYKIASFELVDIPLIKYIAATGKPIIMSCGMGSEEEIREAVEAIRSQGNDQIILLKCCSVYPTVSEDLNLRTITDMREKFGVPVGLSDHSMGSTAAIAAVALGAVVIEKHFCLSRDIPSADSAFSMEPAEFADMIKGVHDAELALGKVFYGPTEAEAGEYTNRRSLFIVEDVEEGEELTDKNVRSIRSYNIQGIKPKYYEEVLGKKVKTKLTRGTPLDWSQFE